MYAGTNFGSISSSSFKFEDASSKIHFSIFGKSIEERRIFLFLCRMFGVVGSPNFASFLQGALISAANRDDFRNDKGKHDTGWGAVWYSETDQKYYRSRKPIFDDESAPNFFLSQDVNGSLVGLSHARLAAPDEPKRTALDSHPFSTHIGDDELIYVTHNGWIDKNKIAAKALVQNPSILNDTEVFTFLLERIEGDSVQERLEAAIEEVRRKGAMKGALNLIVLSVARDGEKTIYFHCDFPDKSKELYYSLYKVLESNQSSAVMSSTVAYKAGYVDEIGKPKNSLVSKCEIGKVLRL
jgi:predicted glutamine amidotransferase